MEEKVFVSVAGYGVIDFSHKACGKLKIQVQISPKAVSDVFPVVVIEQRENIPSGVFYPVK